MRTSSLSSIVQLFLIRPASGRNLWRVRRTHWVLFSEGYMIEAMVQVHMTEAEAARDFHAVLERVREGAEVVIEQDRRPVAVIRMPADVRLLSECIALAEARGSTVTLDEGFVKDVEEGIAGRSEPWNPPSWE
jgi:antitoxin (DNA-binding transcriptional repressor) of toxin-antitoxin stability system